MIASRWAAAFRAFRAAYKHCPPRERPYFWAMAHAMRRSEVRRAVKHSGLRPDWVDPNWVARRFDAMSDQQLLQLIGGSVKVLHDVISHADLTHEDLADWHYALAQIDHARMELRARVKEEEESEL